MLIPKILLFVNAYIYKYNVYVCIWCAFDTGKNMNLERCDIQYQDASVVHEHTVNVRFPGLQIGLIGQDQGLQRGVITSVWSLFRCKTTTVVLKDVENTRSK